MVLFKKVTDLRKYLETQAQTDSSIGFVPTMGALHPGHLSLIDTSKKHTDITVCSIFVNPTQFNDPRDFQKYPITLENDIYLLEKAGCDILFLPSVEEIYPGGIESKPHYELGYLETILEGKFRPGHFQGVCMVVHRLLDIVQPSQLFLGQKDYQQCMVIKTLVETVPQKSRVAITICPTLREPDGLAMSSRNMRLNEEERQRATTIFESLNFIKTHIKKGAVTNLIDIAISKLVENGFKVDYLTIADANNLSPITDWDGEQPAVVLAAAFLNEVRLIDNMVM